MRFLVCLAVLVLAAPSAQAQPAPTPIDAETRNAAIADVGDLIAENYYDAGRGAAIAEELAAFARSPQAAGLDTGQELATALVEFLRERDRHFNAAWRGPEFIAQVQAQWDAEEAAGGEEEDSIERWAEYRPQNYGFNDVRVLEGNIGYMAVTTFNPLIASQSKADAALSFLADTDAVIIDLRGNRGGEPELVNYLLSHFTAAGERVHYNTVLQRNVDAEDLYTIADHPMGHRPDVPLYVLVSSESFSAAEALAYHLQAMGRAMVVGEVTGGGANAGRIFLAPAGLIVFIPDTTGRSPFTGANWDRTGVRPDIEVAAEDALERARVEALTRQVSGVEIEGPEAMQSAYQLALAQAEAGRWVPTPAELEACTGQYNGGRVWLEDGQLRYQGSNNVLALTPFAPGVFHFPDNDTVQVHFPGYRSGRASAMRQAYPSGDFFDRERID